MAEEEPIAFMSTDSRSLKKPLWKGKLFSKDKSKDPTTEQQLDDFLGPMRSKSVVGLSPPQLNFNVSLSQRRPTPDLSRRTTTSAQTLSNAASRLKKPRQKGLRVTFCDNPPDVIGEGGDECDNPALEISLNRKRSNTRDAIPSGGSLSHLDGREPTLPTLHLEASIQNKDDGIGEGKSDNTGWRPLLMQDADLLTVLGDQERGSRLSLRESADPNSFARRIQAKMRAEEGRALQARLDSPASISNHDEADPLCHIPTSQRPKGAKVGGLLEPFSGPSVIQEDQEPIEPSRENAAGLSKVVSPRGLSPILSTPRTRGTIREPNEQRQVGSTETDTMMTLNAPRSNMSQRSVANPIGDNTFADFTTQVERYTGLFRQAVESIRPLTETPLSEWMRAALWWFLKGRSCLEAVVRSRSSAFTDSPRQRPAPQGSKQAVIDLGKTWWICQWIVPEHPEIVEYGKFSLDTLFALINTIGNKKLEALLGLHQKIWNHLRGLTMSMKRNNVLTLVTEPLDSRMDTSIWVKYPSFTLDVVAALSGSTTKSTLISQPTQMVDTTEMILLGDTTRFFSYGTMFVDVCVSTEEDNSRQVAIPCVLTIMRDRTDWHVRAAIASQSELANIVIQAYPEQGPTWNDVDWKVKHHSMQVKLSRGFKLDIVFEEKDFKIIWNIVQYTLKILSSLQPESGETLIYENTLKVFQYVDPGALKAFPAEASPECEIRLFERSVTLTEGTGTRKAHRGFRLVIVTDPKVKTLSSVRHILGYGVPIVFGYLRGENGAPALLINIKEEGRQRSMIMTFNELQARTTMHSLLMGMIASEKESKTSDIPIRSFTIEQPANSNEGSPAVTHLQFGSGTVSIIDQDPNFVNHGYGPAILSEHLRSLITTDWGTVTDRMNLGPGELRVSLDVSRNTVFNIFRQAQEDLTVSVAENLVREALPDNLSEFLQTAQSNPMIRRYDFATLEGLHQFQAAMTGFNVLFDGIASTFAISRRRMVVPIHKKWETYSARIQVIQQGKTTQLLAFFGDFSHGKCMNFALKSTDMYETFSRFGKSGVRIVDAKFALPRTEEDNRARFVCLDVPEYPIEHDDISITFELETERNNILAMMPGSIKETSRIGSLRR